MLELQGRAALSDFRIAKLRIRLQALEPRMQVLASQFVHFVDTDTPLPQAQQELLAKLLTYGPASPPQAPGSAQPVA